MAKDTKQDDAKRQQERDEELKRERDKEHAKRMQERDPAEPSVLPVEPADIAREQEKGGPNPVSTSVEPVKAVTIEEQGIAANEPYPTGNPPETVPGRAMNEPPPAEPAPVARKRGA
jgi:hypothetical protein